MTLNPTPSRPRIVVTQPVHETVLQQLRQHGEVTMNPGPEPWPEAELHRHLAEADAMMAFMPDRVDASTLQHAPRLSTIACALKGYDNFDLEACARAGVLVSFVPDLLTEPTAELAIGLAIAAARHLRAGDAQVRAGGYQGWRPTLYGTGLHGATAAVVGLGPVGRAIVDRLAGFGCARLLGVDPSQHEARVQAVSLDEALQRADYLLLAVPLTPQSRHLVDAQRLALCKRGQILVNVGRGSVVDEAAVAQALEAGMLGAYAADVFELEDWHLADRPRHIDPRLLASPHTVFTPHLGSAVASVRLAIEQRAADNLIAALAGQPVGDALTRQRAAQLA
jgi:phosphonate dehydrogenase